ncbi:MAG TPA: HNH endonuclease signature motif containing protein [Blastocatellia bacterium]|nr:HNH endonuclease signature motif containing protein [Blastocatellia bacterium]
MYSSKLFLSGRRALFLSLALIVGLSGPVLSQDRPAHMPDPNLTPGETNEATKDDLCGAGRKAMVDKVSIKVKSQVFDIYGIRGESPTGYNVDHLVPVSLGGTNSVKNLWPQPLAGEWGYVEKNRLEKRLQRMVCSGELDLRKAQEEIARDWVAAYKRYVGAPR